MNAANIVLPHIYVNTGGHRATQWLLWMTEFNKNCWLKGNFLSSNYLTALTHKAGAGEPHNKGLIRVALVCMEEDYM